MTAILSTGSTGKFHVVCKACLWTSPRPLDEADAFTAADTHPATCPGQIPKHRTAAQRRHANKLISGNY